MTENNCRTAAFFVFEADLERHELRKHGVRIKLTEQPFQALVLLLNHTGQVVTRETFRNALWPQESWGDHDQRLNRIVNKIREALCDSADTPRFVETVPKVGHRFLVNVDKLGDGAAPHLPHAEIRVTSNSISPVSSPTAAEPQLNTDRFDRQFWLVAASALLTCVLAAAVSNRVSPTAQQAIKVSQPVPLTTYVGSEMYPSLSPDGKRVAFAWDGESQTGFHIYTATASGGGAHQITDDPANDVAQAWSSDGRAIAFLRNSTPGRAQVWIVRADGVNPVKLREIRGGILNPSLTWTLDQKWLIVSERCPENGVPALFRISTTTGEEVRISSTSAGQFAGDLSPAISPDGRRLAFTRSTSSSWRDVFVMPLSPDNLPAGDAIRLSDAQSDIDYLSWAPDGNSLVYSAAATVSAPHHLYRIDANQHSLLGITELGIEGDRPTLAGNPPKLAYIRTNIEQSSVWRLDRRAPHPKKTRLLSLTRRDFTTDLSPNGDKIVFSSIRSGETEIWMSRTNGSSLRPLTSIGANEPRWSPDGQRIAFVSSHLGRSDVYVLRLDTGSVQRLTSGGASHLKPSWSRDGRFIYFSSDQTARAQIWKVPADGGDPMQITHHGGLYAVETFDSKSIYFTSAGVPAEVWSTSVNGGEETLVLSKVMGHASIALSRDGLYVRGM